MQEEGRGMRMKGKGRKQEECSSSIEGVGVIFRGRGHMTVTETDGE